MSLLPNPWVAANNSTEHMVSKELLYPSHINSIFDTSLNDILKSFLKSKKAIYLEDIPKSCVVV